MKYIYPEDFVNCIINNDSLKVMQDIPNNSIDLVIADPPYNVGKDYGNLSDKQNEVNYLKFLEKYLIELKRIVKSDIHILTFLAIGQLPKTLNLFNKYFEYVWISCWYAPNKRSLSKYGFNLWQPIYVHTKGNKIKYSRKQDFYRYTTGQEKYNHPTPKPLKLIHRLVQDFSNENDLILDPFLGSGTTAVACKSLGRNFIGIEINNGYCDIANQRLKNTKLSKSITNWIKF